MNKRKFGNTGLMVTPLGLGAGHIGEQHLDESTIEHLLNSVLDEGVNLIDTARGYGLSEERIGKLISNRRKEFILSTKVGYNIPNYIDWTAEIIIAGVEKALKLLKTDYIDIVHLHSCSLEILQRGEVIQALLRMKEEGKVTSVGYSGENEALYYAVDTGYFDIIQTSINIADQRNIDLLLPKIRDNNLGVIAKRPAANAPWRFPTRPIGHYSEVYWDRIKKMGLEFGKDWMETAIRFTAFTEGVSSAIIGTSNPKHFKECIKAVEKGPLPEEVYSSIRETFRSHDQNWIGQV